MDADQPPNLVEVSGQHQEKTAALGELSGPVIPGIRRQDAIVSGPETQFVPNNHVN